MEAAVHFVDVLPPPSRCNKPLLSPEVRRSLRSQPGRWALIQEYALRNSAAAAARRWTGEAGPEFEFTARALLPSSSWGLFARFVGEVAER